MLIQGYHPHKLSYDRKLRSIAEQFRDNATEAEQLLWKSLKGKRLGYKFRRQHPLHGFIVDFYCYELMLVIELDGPIHQDQKERDSLRDITLSHHGFKTLRFSNEIVLTELHSVIKKIFDHTSSTSPFPA
ncbi:MAG: endonuclease domain-containing protein [Patescibacteria group bacterium]|jgi:very-short-patch-repair endonuclease